MRLIMKVKFNLWMRRVTRVIHNKNSSDAKFLGKGAYFVEIGRLPFGSAI
jgi:hypothetical protein